MVSGMHGRYLPAADAINSLVLPGSDLVYTTRDARGNVAAMEAVNADLAAGLPAAIRIDDKDGGPHILVITGFIGGDPRKHDPYNDGKCVIHDPWTGRTSYVSRSELLLDIQGGGTSGVIEAYVA